MGFWRTPFIVHVLVGRHCKIMGFKVKNRGKNTRRWYFLKKGRRRGSKRRGEGLEKIKTIFNFYLRWRSSFNDPFPWFEIHCNRNPRRKSVGVVWENSGGIFYFFRDSTSGKAFRHYTESHTEEVTQVSRLNWSTCEDFFCVEYFGWLFLGCFSSVSFGPIIHRIRRWTY